MGGGGGGGRGVVVVIDGGVVAMGYKGCSMDNEGLGVGIRKGGGDCKVGYFLFLLLLIGYEGLAAYGAVTAVW